jgi:heme ABC exporter ATP-binding subunit CcmA
LPPPTFWIYLMSPVNAVVAVGVGKSFGRLRALREVELELCAGTFALLLGPNGSGKSTLLRLLAGLATPSVGRVEVWGGDPRRHHRIRRRIGFLGEQSMLYEHLSAVENLRFFARLYGIDESAGRIWSALEAIHLTVRAHSPVRTYSRGMKQQLALARACLHHPSLLLLDEPFSGLDEAAVRGLQARLDDQRRRGVTCVLATHRAECVLDLADRVLVLKDGRLQEERRDAPGDRSRGPVVKHTAET